jgi:hypothetical protein
VLRDRIVSEVESHMDLDALARVRVEKTWSAGSWPDLLAAVRENPHTITRAYHRTGSVAMTNGK